MFGRKGLSWQLTQMAASLVRIETVLERLEKQVAAPEENGERDAAARMQAGIDSILGYQWPPAAKEGESD